MSLSTDEAVRETYRRAVQDHLQKALRTPEDWDRYTSIVAETNARLEGEQASFARDFQQRVSEAQQIVLREAHGLTFDQPLPPGAEARLSSDALETKTEARVYRDHERRLSTIRDDAADQYVDLTAEIRARDAPAQTQSQRQDRSQDRSGPTRS